MLIGLLALVVMLFEYINQRSNPQPLHADYRTPAANPPVEPDRPDLFEEPRLNDQPPE